MTAVADSGSGGRAMSLDVGSKTIGLALGDERSGIASAWQVLRRGGQSLDVRAVLECARQRDVQILVVGLPLELDGRVGHRARLVRRLTMALEAAVAAGEGPPGARVIEWDERFSTAAAERTLVEADMSRKRRKTKIDAVAAQFILQGWLDSRASGRAQAPGVVTPDISR